VNVEQVDPAAVDWTEPSSSIDAWAYHYVLSDDLDVKCDPGRPPRTFDPTPTVHDLRRPGRPAQLRVSTSKPRSMAAAALSEPRNRAKLMHKFWHHELQAAELMCWAILRFADAEESFRAGLLGICQDELRHMRLYREHIEALGFEIGDFEVRDWFWDRVPTCRTKTEFVALMGMGLEAANLEHTPRFADWFRRAGDEAGAALQDQVGREEVAHVRFAMRWFRQWTGRDDFHTWSEALPKPLTPLLMRGKTINRAAREKAEMTVEFIDALGAWRPERHGRR